MAPKRTLADSVSKRAKKVATENWKATYAFQCASESGYLQVVKELINLEGNRCKFKRHYWRATSNPGY